MRLFGKRYFELDLVRAVAIILVVLFHLNQRIFHLSSAGYLGLFLGWGWHGVDLFFVLSGFLIGGQILEDNLEGRFTFRRFYLKRILRTFPPYYFYLIFALLVSSVLAGEFALRNPVILKDVVLHLLYVNNYLEVIRRQSGLYWSLAIEEQFYLLLPLLMYMLIRYARRYLLHVTAALILLGTLIRTALYIPGLNMYDWWHRFYTPFHTRFDELLFGVFAACIFVMYREPLRRLSGTCKALLLAVSAACLLSSYLYGSMGGGYFASCWQFSVTALGFAILVLYITTFPIRRFIPLKGAFRTTARLSYTMYIYHIVILNAFLALLQERGIPPGRTSAGRTALITMAYVAALYLGSAFFYSIVEMPFMRLRKRIVR